MTRNVLHQLGALTGLGWTTSLLGYVSVLVGYAPRLVTEPHTLLYASLALFLATLGIDRAAESELLGSRDRTPARRRDDSVPKQQ